MSELVGDVARDGGLRNDPRRGHADLVVGQHHASDIQNPLPTDIKLYAFSYMRTER